MASWDDEYPVREAYPPVLEEYPQPRPETEFRLPDPGAEDAAPPGTDYFTPDPSREFTPPGSGGEGPGGSGAARKRRIRRLLYSAAALVLIGLLCGAHGTPLSAPVAVPTPMSAPASPASTPESAPVPEPTPEQTVSPEPAPVQTVSTEPTPEPLGKEPVIEPFFYYFSHEHHGRIVMSNTDALHSVCVSVRETVLNNLVWEDYLDEEEIRSGLFELPVLSTGDYYMEHMQELDPLNGWPKFELSVKAWYENEAGDGEDTMEMTIPAASELGIGLSYWEPSYTWDEELPPDSFVIKPWEETEDVSYVINDPDAVTDPTIFSVDIVCNGRHAAPEEYEVILDREEYSILDSATGEYIPTVGVTKVLILRRPDWMPEEGTLHVTIIQRVASTNELFTREGDYDYPQRYDWES